MKYAFPAIFYDDDGWIAVRFADHLDWYTCGKNIKEAIEYATDILNIKLLELIESDEPVPAPLPIEKVMLNEHQTVRLITVDIDDYQHVVEQLRHNPIRYAREQAGMNIKELAEYLDAPYRTVQDWNSGKNRPPKWCEQLIFDRIMQLKK